MAKKLGTKDVEKMSDTQLLVLKTERAIKFKKEQLAKTKKFNREGEREIADKIQQLEIVLKALKK